MRRGIIIKAILFVAIFVTTAFFVNKLYYRGYENENYQKTNTSLPVLYVRHNDEIINRMLAYRTKIDTSLDRSVVTTVGEDKKMSILLPNDSDYTKQVSYELRSFDGQNLIEDGDLTEPSRYNGFVQYDISLRMDMTIDKEYQIVIKLSDGKETLRYYSRLIRLERDYIQSYVDYMKSFNKAMFDEKYDENGDLIADYELQDSSIIVKALDQDNSNNSSNLGVVNLQSNYDVVTFGNLKPERTSELVPVIKEINETECTVQYQYTVSSGTGSELKNYIIDEYYELSYDNSNASAKLENYKRNMDYVFNYKDVNTILNSLSMGVCSNESEPYITTEDGKRAAFITENQLWFYDYKNTCMSNIYGFWKGTMADIQEIQNRLGFNLLYINDDGVVDFCVYGRIPRGTHEGQNGIILYEYKEETGELKELSFIETEITYDLMTQGVGRFAYYNRDYKVFYTILDNALIKAYVESDEMDYVVDNMPMDRIYFSDDYSTVAFMNDSRLEKSKGITIVDCESNRQVEIRSKYEISEVIGFVGTDIVYGDGTIDDIYTLLDGRKKVEFTELCIVDKSGNEIKRYKKNDKTLKNVEIGVNVINFELVDKNAEKTEPEQLDASELAEEMAEEADIKEEEPEELATDTDAIEDDIYIGGNTTNKESDYISFKQETKSGKLTFKNTYTEAGYAALNMVFPSNVYIRKTPKLMLAKTKKENNTATITMNKASEDSMLYVFSYEGLSMMTETAAEAMDYITDNGGVLLDGNGNVLFKTKPYNSYYTVAGTFPYQQCSSISESLNACAYMSILASGGKADYGELLGKSTFEECLSDSQTAVPINLYGMKIKTALLFLSDGIPFTARLSDGRYVLVVSYNLTAIRYYDPVDGKEVRVSRKRFVNDIAVYGNIIYTFAVK